MKKWIAVFLTLVLLFALTACGSGNDKKSDTPVAKDTTSSVEAQTEQIDDEPSTEEAAQTEETDTGWIDAYASYLDGKLAEYEDSQEASFGLFFIDDNDTPELVLTPGVAHAVGAHLITYYNGRVLELGEYGSWGSFGYEEKTGVIVSGYMGSGATSTFVCRLNDGMVEELWSGEEADGSIMGMEEGFTYISNDVEVSKAEYDRMYAQYVPIEIEGIGAPVGDGGVKPLLTKENVRLYFDALRDPDSMTSLRTGGKMTLSGTLEYTEDYDGIEHTILRLDKPFAAQVQGCRFPYLVVSVEVNDFSDTQNQDGQSVTLTGSIQGGDKEHMVSLDIFA